MTTSDRESQIKKLKKVVAVKKVVTVYSKEPPRTEGADKVRGILNPRLVAGLPFPVSELLEFKACHDSGNIFSQVLSRDSPGIILANPRKSEVSKRDWREGVGD